MGEVEKEKVVKTKKSSNAHQTMTALFSSTIRGIIGEANERSIKREDIVSLLKENGLFILVYFK